MKTIDIHAHLVPQSLWKALDAKAEWYGYRQEAGDNLAAVTGGGKRNTFSSPKVRYGTQERLKDMDAQGVDVQVVSIHTPFMAITSSLGRAAPWRATSTTRSPA
jgi:hypothetical protein